MWPGTRTPPLSPLPQGCAGPQQQALQQALLAQRMHLPQQTYLPSVQQAFQPQQLAPAQYQPMVGTPVWDQNSLASTFSTMTLTPLVNNDWYLDTGASSHMTSHDGTLSHSSTPQFPSPTSIVVGNGSLLPVTATGKAQLGPLILNNVLVSPSLIKNLISVRQFTIDNHCSVEFDPYGCSVKDLLSRNVIIRCNSSGPLYPLQLPVAHSLVASAAPSHLWHRRLGHPGREALSKLASAIPACNKSLDPICHACQLGRHVRLPFGTSVSRASNNFDLIHCDLWTSPIPSISGYKYYLVILDDCSHYLWTFPLRLKSDTFSTLSNFFAYVSTQFGNRVKAVQSDNDKEFDNSSTRTFLLTHGVLFRMSCPYTSPQNGKAERIIRTTNDVIRSLLFQASMPPSYWVEALHTATLLLNILPTKTLDFSTPHSALLGSAPSYDHLRVFGCKCYPNLSATAPHKLAPRSALCIFIGYSAHHKGYRCLDPTTNRIIISRHVIFDESTFLFAEQPSPPAAADFTFLDEIPNPTVPL
jgi:transposase InsO family protein